MASRRSNINGQESSESSQQSGPRYRGKHALPINSIVITLVFVTHLVGLMDGGEHFKLVIKQRKQTKAISVTFETRL